MNYIDRKSTRIKIHFRWIIIDYFCNFIDTDNKMTILSIIIQGTPLQGGNAWNLHTNT